MTSRTLTLSMASIALFAWSLPASSQGNPIPTATHPENSPEAVAVVNGEPLYAEDIELLLGRVHTGASENQRTDYDFDRLLFRIVNDTLLAQEARALGLQNDVPIPSKLEQQRIGLALSHFEQEKVWKDLTVTEDEIRAAFEEGYSSATFHVLTTRSREEAEAARQDLENGEEFESLAMRSSIDGFRGRGGLVSNVHYIDLPAAISPELFRLEPDQIAGPILSDLGWTVMQAESFEKADPAKYPIVRRFLERVLRERKAEAKRAEIAEQLRRTHPVQIHQDVLSAIGQERLPTSRIVAQIDDPNAPVATIGAQVISAKIYGNALNKEWKRIRNEDTALSRRDSVLDGLVQDALFREESTALGYDKLPSVERRVRAKERDLLVPEYLTTVLAPTVEIEPEELQTFYKENLDRFRPPPQLHLGQITTSTPEEAEEVAELMRQGTDLAWLARQYSIDEYKSAGGDRGWLTPTGEDQVLGNALLLAFPGDVLGPYDQGGRFVVVRVNDRQEQEPRSFEQSRDRARSVVFAEKLRSTVDEHIQQLRSNSEIVVHLEVLESMIITASPALTESDSSGGGHGGEHSVSRPESRP